ncbi:hypothetical protein J7F01_33920 [Streptomyces sp. ISL-22]|uniref:hypothetical protein n=1 Tax=unclassified Streptomyces TaxID=2593676 RepID=UPI001BEB0882|nr:MULTISPECIES: hypothetical protein [unclassified Streptomyces]MBT2421255.1 hypothetical protein [Streptomyces sp. ISL-24]MBT2437070.1 hypothetical protein [Streptomyces sp. ISL-22]
MPGGALQGAYYKIGVWGGGEVILHGSTGKVFLLFAGFSRSAGYDDEEGVEGVGNCGGHLDGRPRRDRLTDRLTD